MLAIAQPIYTQKVPLKLQSRKIQKCSTRSVKVQAALPNPDLVNYAQLQLVTWILPMTIAGRLLKVEYPQIAIGLTVMTAAKLSLAANGIIHF